MIVGLIPACGHSRRMGQPKMALPVAGKTVLEQVISTLLDGAVNPVLVVLGPHVADLSEKARAAGADVLLLPWPTPDMRATIERGLDWIEDKLRPNEQDDILLVPGDHPTLNVGIIREIIEAREKNHNHTIIVPTYEGKRGHPTLLRWNLVPGLRVHPSNEGINTYLRQLKGRTLELPVASPSIIEDLDTPEDYERLLRSFNSQKGS